MTSSCSEGDIRDAEEHSMCGLYQHVVGRQHSYSWGAILYFSAVRVAAQEVAGAARIGNRSSGIMNCVGCNILPTMIFIWHNRFMMKT